MSLSDLASLDPTGTLSAATSAIKLVGKIAQVAPALKNASGSKAQPAGPKALQRSTTAPGATAAPVRKDPERERRAFETVNFVLREFGSRLCAAELVNEHALTKALVAASQHVDVKLFSGEANRLFASLSPKLADPLLVNSVFTAIYFIGVLNAELTRSLPNFKGTVGPKLVQQLFRTAIGEDAFRENLSANLDAYETVATTAGLLRPTDPDYSTFPGFPAFSASRYSSRSLNDTWSNKFAYDKLCKHFQRFGFPQPAPARQAELGIIGDWRFLMSDTNTQVFDVEKADKSIGENFGRVLYWLVCSADRLPPGQAIVVYYDQHIELIKWIGTRLGYQILYPAVDLDMTGPHAKLDGRLKSIVNSWIVLVYSETFRAAKQAASEKWNLERAAAAKKMAQAAAVAAQQAPQRAPSVQVQAVPSPTNEASRRVSMAPSQIIPGSVIGGQSIEAEINHVNQWFNVQLKPQCQVFIKMPPANEEARRLEARRLEDLTEREIMLKLDALQIPDDHPGKVQRKAIIDQAHKMLATVNAFAVAAPSGGGLDKIPLASPASSSTSEALSQGPLRSPSVSSTQTTPLTSPPPYPTSASPFDSMSPQDPPKSAPKIRRKAPPPPRKPMAKALFDFIPEEGDEEELAFKEGDDLEIVEKTAALEEEGWCRAKIKGTSKIGLAPLEYLEIAPVPVSAPSKPYVASSLPVGQAVGAQPGALNQSNPAVVKPLATVDSAAHTSSGIQDPLPIAGRPTATPATAIASTATTGAATSNAASAGQPAALQHPGKGPIEVKNKLGAGGIAGLAIAGVGTAAGVAALLQNQGSEPIMQSRAQPTQVHQHPPSTAHITNNNDQNAQQDNQQQDPYANQDASGQTTYDPAASSDLPYDSSTGPVADLSGLDGGFQPQPGLSDPVYAADLGAGDPYFAAQYPDPGAAPDFGSSFAAENATVSPFAAVATPPADAAFVGGDGAASTFAGVAGANAPAPLVAEEEVVVTETECVMVDENGDVAVYEEQDVAVEYDVAEDEELDFE